MRLHLAFLGLAACGSCGGGGTPAGDDVATVPCDEPTERAGEATYYDADGSGNCSFEPSPGAPMVAALNAADYDGAAWCGACAAVDGPTGSVTVRIVDQCPGCAEGDLDLSSEAFAQISALSAGRVPITWRFVACEVAGPLRYHFKDGSNASWTAIQLRNHRHAIATLEAKVGGAYQAIAREDYNYFVAPAGLGVGPLDLRITDVHGLVAEDPAITTGDDIVTTGDAQLAACE